MMCRVHPHARRLCGRGVSGPVGFCRGGRGFNRPGGGGTQDDLSWPNGSCGREELKTSASPFDCTVDSAAVSLQTFIGALRQTAAGPFVGAKDAAAVSLVGFVRALWRTPASPLRCTVNPAADDSIGRSRCRFISVDRDEGGRECDGKNIQCGED